MKQTCDITNAALSPHRSDVKVRARNRFQWWFAGRRVNVLLALLPSALHIDPPPGSGAFPFRISRGECVSLGKNPSRQTLRKNSLTEFPTALEIRSHASMEIIFYPPYSRQNV